VAEVETDKATMEFRSFDKGTVLALLVDEGASLVPDAPALILGAPGEDVSALVAQARGGAPASAPAPSPDAGPRPDAPREVGAAAPQARAAAAAPASAPVTAPAAPGAVAAAPRTASAAAGSTPSPVVGSAERVLASPLVRRLAREHGLDLSGVEGSGPRGRIVKRDVEAALASGAGAAASARLAAAPTGSGVVATAAARESRVEKLSPMRRTIARRLTESKQTVPHFYLTVDLDAGPLLEARAQINAMLERDGEKVSVNDLLIKACAVALRRVPECNASFAGDAIHYHGRVDVSVAVAIADGLVTPVVRDADRKGVLEIAREVRELAGRAREKKLRPEEMSDGTFSISNLGMFDIEEFAAVINPPEGAILAVGAVRDEPVVRGGAVVPGKRMKVTLSCDHRVIDGAVGARWLQALRHAVERPATMLV
jgi:pyruvate dehydrogenase E2 component (dihydrolipoamide acetyltransferase)